MLIYHIVLPEVWAVFDSGLYRPRGLEIEGFIHCSFDHQLDGVIDRYYGNADQIVVLGIETERLMSRVLLEPSTNDEVYPHIYGPINRDAIVSIARRQIRHHT